MLLACQPAGLKEKEGSLRLLDPDCLSQNTFLCSFENALLKKRVKSHVIPTTVQRARLVISARAGRRDLVLTILEELLWLPPLTIFAPLQN